MDEFDELHVVSDLHLGGDPGHQIFKGTELLVGHLLALCAAPSERRIAFVINGDFVDFLAGQSATYFDPDGAAEKLAAIARDAAFAPIFDAIASFIGTPGRTLVVVLGNHDLELAMPRVQAAFFARLGAQEDRARRGRIVLSLGGAGFAAYVGGKRVLCLHGNEVDAFNLTDYEHLRRAARDQVFGWQARPWLPNAGTQLVIDVMNGIKQRLPFIDLLKPETDAVIPILFALNQASVSRLLDALEVAGRVSWDSLRKSAGFLQQTEEPDDGAPPVRAPRPIELRLARGGSPAELRAIEVRNLRASAASEFAHILRKAFVVPSEKESQGLANQLLDETERRFSNNEDPLDLVAADGDEKLGFGNLSAAALRATWSKFLGHDEPERLRAALRPLARDKTFDLGLPDAQFKRIDELVPTDIPIVVSGHTHLARELHRPSGGLYLNTGTFARLIRLDSGLLADPDRFRKFYEAVQKPRIPDLDATDFVMHLPLVARIVARDAGVEAGLYKLLSSGGKVEPRRLAAEKGQASA